MLRVKALLAAGLTVTVMAPVTSEARELFGGLEVELAARPEDAHWRRSLAIRAEIKTHRPELLFLDGVKLPPGALLGLGIRVMGLGPTTATLKPNWAHGFVETHPGIDVGPVAPNVTAVPPIWNPAWYPPVEDLGPYGIPAGAFTVGSVATHADYLRWLVEAGHWLPLDLPIHFLIAVPAVQRGRLRRRVLGTMFPQRYHFRDAVEQAPSLLASCDLTVMSHDEPVQRRSTLNALQHGVPLMTLLSGTPVPYVLRVEGAEQLAARVLELYEHRDRHAALVEASREYGGQSGDSAEILARALLAASE